MDTPSEVQASAPSGKRRLATTILLVLFCLLSMLSLVAGWARLQINDTDQYVETVTPLASDPAIQRALIDRVTNQLSSQLDERVTIDIVDNSALAAPVAMLVEQYIRDTVSRFVGSDEFPVIWEQINRASHSLVTAVLTGSGTASVGTDKGKITLDIAPLITEVINRLSDRGLDIVNRIQVDQLDTSFVVYESEDLARAQDAVRLLERLAVVLPILALASLVAALAVATDRRSTVIRAGLGLAATMALFLMLLAFLRWWIVDHLSADADPQAVTVFFETIGRLLRDAAQLLIVIGLLTSAAVFVTRPEARLRRGGRAAGGNVKAAWMATTERLPGLSQVGSWIVSHRMALAVTIGVAGCLLVVALDPLDASQAVWILIMTAVGWGALALIQARMTASSAAAIASPQGALSVTAITPVSETSEMRAPSSERVVQDRLSPADHGRESLIAIAGELSAEDLRILSRVAAGLRETGSLDRGIDAMRSETSQR